MCGREKLIGFYVKMGARHASHFSILVNAPTDYFFETGVHFASGGRRKSPPEKMFTIAS